MISNHDEENRLICMGCLKSFAKHSYVVVFVVFLLIFVNGNPALVAAESGEPIELNHVWGVEISGSTYSTIDGTLYVFDSFPSRVHLVDEGDGTILWTTDVLGQFISPTVSDDDGTIFFLTHDQDINHLYCMGADGLKWNSTYETVFPFTILQLYDGHIFLCTGEGIIEVLDYQGNTVSVIDTGLGALQCIGVNENIILTYDGNNIYGLDHQGSLKWDYALPEGTSISDCVLDERVYLWLMIRGSSEWGDTFLPTTKSVFLVLDEDGTFLWNHTFDENEISAGFVIGDRGEIYASSVEGISVCVFCLDHDGKQLWNHTYKGSDRPSRPFIAGNRIYVAVYRFDTVKELLVFDEDGDMIRYSTGELKMSSQPAVMDENIYFASSDGYLHRFEMPQEEEKVNRKIPGFQVAMLLFALYSTLYLHRRKEGQSAFQDKNW